MTHTTPTGTGFVALLEAFRRSGGTAPGDVVSRLLVEHRARESVGLARLVQSRRVFGFEWRSSLWIPMFQFDDDLSIASSPQRVRCELPELWSGWAVALWFATSNGRLDGQRPVDLLATDVNAVLRAAQALPWPETMLPMHARPAQAPALHA